MDPESREEEQHRLLGDERYRAIVTVLQEAEQPLDVEALAEHLVTRDVDVIRTEEFENRAERTRIALHHNRLPRLAEAGFVEYDRETQVTTLRADDPPDVEWRDQMSFEELVRRLRPRRHPGEDSSGVIEGRESVIEYGRQLADEAEQELFCMYVSTDLLEEECVHRGANAIDRGVEMYVGTRDAEVRDLARRHLPEATLWEPQLDWLNTLTYPRVGRLVLVDRRKVLLAVLDEPGADGTRPRETALIGEGEDHPLVVLVRELLGPRLDYLDFQSTNFRSELPT